MQEVGQEGVKASMKVSGCGTLFVAACKANRFGLQTTPLFDQCSWQILRSSRLTLGANGPAVYGEELAHSTSSEHSGKQASQTFMLQEKGRLDILLERYITV